jgi:Cu/Ag efflux protein CusF
MNNTSKWLSTLVVSFASFNVSFAETPKPAVTEAAAVSITATVEAIDYKNRSITLKGPEGNTQTMVVGPEATRFDKVKKGDVVQVDYLESVAVVVQSPDKQIATAEGTQSVIVRNQGRKPSGTLVQTDVVTATVEKIDAKARKATLKGPNGNMFNISIAPDVENLENVKKGDQLLVQVTRSLALDVRKPGK